MFEALVRIVESAVAQGQAPHMTTGKMTKEAGSILSNKNLAILYAYSIGVSCFVFFLELSSIYIPIDGEISTNFYQTISLGRWFHAVLHAVVLPEPFLPYFTTLIGLAAIALSATLAAGFLLLNSGLAFVFCTFFVTFPSLAYQFEFINQSDTVFIGYALAVASAILLWQAYLASSLLNASIFCIGAAVALAFALGTYQSLITVPIILVCGRWIIEDQRRASPTLLRVVAGGFAFLVIAIAIYVVISHVFQRHYGVPAAQSYYAGYLSTALDLRARIKNSLDLWRAITTGTVNYGFATYLIASLAALALLLGSFRVWHPSRIASMAAIVAILLLPFGFAFLVGGPLPARIYVSANLSSAILLTLCLRRAPQLVVLVVTAVIAVVHIALVSALFYSDLRVRHSDVLMANRIEALIETKFGNRIGQATHVYFHGGLANQIEKKLPASDVFGSSLFFWDGGNTLRIIGLMDGYGIARYQAVTRDDLLKIKPRLAALPKWPDPESVQLVDGILVIKLGDTFGWLPFPVD